MVKKKIAKKSKENKYDQYEKENSENEGFGLGQYVNLKTKKPFNNVKEKVKHVRKDKGSS